MTNIQSLKSKLDELAIVLSNEAPELVCLTETWLSSEIESNLVNIKGFTLVRNDRHGKRGGGTAIYVRDDFVFDALNSQGYFNLEAEGTLIDFPLLRLIILCLYIPPHLKPTSLETIEDDINRLLDDHLAKFPNRDIIILGDFNKFDVRLLETDLSLADIVKKPTRGASTLDHVLISDNLKRIYDPSNVTYNPPVGKSDHLTLLIEPNKETKLLNHTRQHVVYDYRKSNIEKLLNKADSSDWKIIVNHTDDVNVQWKNLHNHITSLVNDVIPHKTVYLSMRDKSWMTPLTKTIINDKWAAYRAKNWSLFNHLKRKARKEILKAKSIWAKKLKDSAHGLWRIAKHLSGKKKKNELANLITLYKSPQALAEKIGEAIEVNDSRTNEDFPVHDDTWQVRFSEKDIEKQLCSLPQSKAAGPDLIPNRVYALLAPFIAAPLKIIFETSVSQRHFPEDWKKGIVVPIPKTNPPLLNKLRTITLLPSPSKIFEKLILRNISSDILPLISDNQHAFRKGASTTTALIQILDTVTQIFDDPTKRGYAIISLDFSRAFDKVNHQILLQKISKSRLSNGFLLWLKSYLSERTFQVKIQGQLSKVYQTREGVPQGSVLGPALFAILVGDLCTAMERETHTLVQYADDANIIIPLNDEDPHKINTQLREQLTKVQRWCECNKQELNEEKTKAMINTRGTTSINNHMSLQITSSLKILGVLLNDRLKWDDHVDFLCKKSAQRLHLLRALKPFVEQHELHDVYTAVVRAPADYCCPAFVKLSKKLEKRLQRVEKRAHRIIYGDDGDYKCNCCLDGFVKRREYLSMKLMQKVLKNEKHLLFPRMLKRLTHSNKLSNSSCRTSIRQNSFIPYTTLMINQPNK